MERNLTNFTDVLCDDDEIANSQPLSLPSSHESSTEAQGHFASSIRSRVAITTIARPPKRTGQHGDFRSVEEIDPKYRHIFTYPFFNLVQSSVIEDALYSDKSMVVCAPTGSGKTVVFEMAIVQLLMELEDKNYTGDFKIIYMAPIKALCTERLSEWYPKFTKLGLMCIEVTGDTDVEFSQIKPYSIIVTTPEKWDMLTRRWRDHRGLADVIELFLIDEVHILNDATRGPVLEAVVSRMKTVEVSQQAAHRIEQLKKQYDDSSGATSTAVAVGRPPRIRFVAVSATVSNPEDVAAWLGTEKIPAVYYKFGDECRPVKLKRVVEGYPCPQGMSIFKFDIILNYKLWPIIQKHHDGKPTLIFCNTRKSVALTAETLSREITINFTPDQKAKLTALASTIKNKKLQALVLSGVGCHHAGLLYEERLHIEQAFRNRDLPILITTTTLAMGVNLPAHLVIIKNTQQYVNGQYQEYSISTVLQMVGRAGRPQFDTEATAVIMTRFADKSRYQALVGGDEPLQSYLHKRLPENLNSEAALGTVGDVAQCVQWVRSTFLSVRAAKDPRRYLGLAPNAPPALISKKIEELCVKAMNGLASAGLITMDEASCIESTEAGRLMSVFYLDLETMKQIMKIEGKETLDQLLRIVCECHELSEMHLRVDERRTLNALNRNNAAETIRFPMKGKISTRQMKLNCIIQAVLGCLPISDPSLNQEAMKVMRIADRICKCMVAYVTRPDLISGQPQFFTALVNSLTLAKCVNAHMWENSSYVSKQLKGIGPTFSTLLASAGKTTFTLLEESHPRDLERIMNKGAPAGNVLRKQVGLLPKYQLTACPLDESRVSVELMLLNKNHLAEHREHLTAGDTHKCYIVAGDSENCLLFFSSFKDKDLINVYDGIITLEIARKHRFEHKISVHCISSNWVGVDVKCEYKFKSIEPSFIRAEAIHPMPADDILKNTAKKQTSITNIFKERKRKTCESDITQSKEKKKRETALIEKFNVLKKSFAETSKELKEDQTKSAQMSKSLINNITVGDIWDNANTSIEIAMGDIDDNFSAIQTDNTNVKKSLDTLEMKEYDVYPHQDVENHNDDDTLIVDDRVDSILNEIETEISKSKTVSNRSNKIESSFFAKPSAHNIQAISNSFPKLDTYKYSYNEGKKRKTANNKCNLSFMETIEKNASLNNTDNIPQRDSGFSDTIKRQIEKFLQNTSNKKTNTDSGIQKLLQSVDNIHSEINGTNTGKDQRLHNDATNATARDINMILPAELPAVCLNLKETIPNEQLSPPHEYHDGHADNNNLSFARLDLCKEANPGINHSDKKTLIETDEIITLNTDYDGDTVYNMHGRENVPTKFVKDEEIFQKQEVTKDIILIDLSGQECSNHCVNDVEKDEILIDNFNIETNVSNINTCKASKDDMAIEMEFKDQFEEDIQSVGHVIRKKKDYENKLLEGFDTHSLKHDINSKSLLKKPLQTFNLLALPQTGTKLASGHQSNNKTNVKTLKKPTFKPPLKQTTIKKVDNSFVSAVNLQTDSNDTNNHNNRPSLPENISRTFEQYPLANTSQEMIHTQLLQSHKERETFEHKSQYSFSATKIDVCTRNNHLIQIIRKVKVDLDVTEILSKVGNREQTKTKYEKSNINKTYQTETSPGSLPSIKCSSGEVNYTTIDNANKDSINLNVEPKALTYRRLLKSEYRDTSGKVKSLPFCRKSIAESFERKPEHILKRYETQPLLYNQKERRTNELTTNTSFGVENEIKNIEYLKKYLPSINGNTIYSRHDNTNKPQCIERDDNHNNQDKLDETKNEDRETKATFTSLVENNNSPKDLNIESESKNKDVSALTKNTIGNILLKYSVLLRKNNSNIIDNAEIKLTQDNIKEPPVKTKRTYKIKDIQNKLEIPLPKILITVEATRKPRPSNNDIVTKIKNVGFGSHNLKNVVEESSKNSTIPELKPNKLASINMLEHSKIHDLEQLLSSASPKTEHKNCADNENNDFQENSIYLSPVDDIPISETLEDFNLDQSLLNPKTLLQQCFSKDETIIPPPSGFCDNDDDRNIYSPAQFDEDYDCSDFTYQVFDESYEDEPSIFEEKSHSVLSSKEELETWIFSEDAEVDSRRFQIRKQANPEKSCTVMRSNVPLQANRKSQLGRFKFTHKKKLTL